MKKENTTATTRTMTTSSTTTTMAGQELSPVEQMFNGRSVFITGGSGFIGRVLIEKLLRCYPCIERIYLLMRTKKGQTPQERLHNQLLKIPIFDTMRQTSSHLFDKLKVIPGDISQPQLGISNEDLEMMLADPTLAIVIHSAATIKFDEPLKVSVTMNLTATNEILNLCRRLPNLVSLCHISTAYVNSHLKDNRDIEEQVYPMSERPQQLIQMANCMDQELMQELKLKLIDQRPNTYTYTKALAEHLILEEAKDLPVAIVRPSIVVAAWKEPLPGWIDNLNGPTGLILAIGKGLLRSMRATASAKADIVPVDVVVNTIIASAYYTAKINGKLMDTDDCGQTSKKNLEQKEENEEEKEKEENETKKEIAAAAAADAPEEKKVPIIHCNSGDMRPITWGEMNDFFPIVRHYPSVQVFRYPFGTFKTNVVHDLICRLFAHYLPALLIDLVCACMGKKRQLMFIYGKIHQAVEALTHFCTTNYNFKTRNLNLIKNCLEHERDRQHLYMDISELSWWDFWHDYVLGCRRYILKESDDSLQEARKTFKRAFWVEMFLRAFLVLLVAICCRPLIQRLIPVASNALTSLQLTIVS